VFRSAVSSPVLDNDCIQYTCMLFMNVSSPANRTMAKLALISVVLCVFTCVVAVRSNEAELSNLKQTVGNILKRLDERDNQIETLRVKLAEQETLNAELTLRVRQLESVAIPVTKGRDDNRGESPVPANKSEEKADYRVSPKRKIP